jgi:hypothetical protein
VQLPQKARQYGVVEASPRSAVFGVISLRDGADADVDDMWDHHAREISSFGVSIIDSKIYYNAAIVNCSRRRRIKINDPVVTT